MRPLAAAVACLALAGCTGAFLEVDPMRDTPASPASAWIPSDDLRDEIGRPPGEEETTAPSVALELERTPDGLGLTELVDFALARNPNTRSSWAAARAAAAAAGGARSEYYPTIEVEGDVTFSKGIGTSGTQAFIEQSYGPTASLSWLLFDFGGRSATAEAALQAMIGANWEHNQSLLDVALDVAQSYYTCVGAEALVEADELSVRDARQSVDAARARMRAKVGTAYDLLQAETTLGEIQLDLENDRGQVEIARGQLAESLGLAANVPVYPRPPANRPRPDAVTAQVDELIAIARSKRPDLAAAWASLREADANVAVAKSAFLPTLQATAEAQRLYATTEITEGGGNFSSRGWPYSAVVSVTLPVFSGFALINQLREARADAAQARSDAAAQDRTAVNEVWASYTNLRTAGQTIRTSDRLIDAATKSYEAARVAYTNGLGNIIELLEAQISLAGAREARIETETTWFVALAQLAHDVGILMQEMSSDEVLQELDAAPHATRMSLVPTGHRREAPPRAR